MAKPLKIGLVLDDSLDTPDGVQQYVLTLGAWLSSQGYSVHYLVGQTARSDLVNLHSLSRNVSVHSNGNRMRIPLPAQRAAIRRLLRAENFDILHVQMPYSPLLAGRIVQAAGPHTAVIGTFHIVAYSKLIRLGSRLLAMASYRSLRHFQTVISVSAAAAAYARDTYHVETTVLPNVFDYQRFRSAQPLLSGMKRLRILFLGRLVERKGCQDLLTAIALLRRQANIPDFEVVICGKGGLLSSLEQFVTSQGLQDMVGFAGFVSEADKPGYYASADIAVFPSTGGESFGIVLIEAMASGRAAVLAAANSGYTSVMEPRPELLFPPGDVPALAAKLDALLRNASARRDAATWGGSYSRRFDVGLVGPVLVSEYHQALRKIGRP